MTAAGQPDAGRSLLAVFAHPDDEALASGGLLAWCSARGATVSLLCASRGGLGQIDDPTRMEMGVTRARELDAAARVLGVHEVILLDHRNGFLPWVPCDVMDADIRAAIIRLQPDVVITFDEDGLYWHPDHIVMYERPTLVIDAGDFAAEKLAALRCHRSQIAGDGLDRLPANQAARLLGVEHYRRAAVGAQGEAFIERLGSRVGS